MVPRRVSTVVLTGVGFSKDAGLPLTWELVPRGRELSKIRFGIEFVSLIDELTQEILQEPMGDEIEAILTRLKVLEFYSDKYSTKVKGSPEEQNYIWRLLQLEMAIYIVVWSTLWPLPNVHSLYDDFLKSFGDDVAFATLNYDMLLETVFNKNQRPWHYPIKGEPQLFDNQLGPYGGMFYTPPEAYPKSITYLKLHGSFNWYYCWYCENFNVMRDPSIGLHCALPRKGTHPFEVGSPWLCNSDACSEMRTAPGEGQAVLKPLITPPARMKEYSRAPVLRHWAFFDLLLAQARELILVGTSIRDEDVLLVNSLDLLRLKNPHIERIVVIDPKPEIEAKVKRLSEVKTIRYSSLEAYVNR
jgi:hypothetical protein